MSKREVITTVQPYSWRWNTNPKERDAGKWGVSFPVLRVANLELIVTPDGGVHQTIEDAFHSYGLQDSDRCHCVLNKSVNKELTLATIRAFLSAVEKGLANGNRQLLTDQLFAGSSLFLSLFSSWMEDLDFVSHPEDDEDDDTLKLELTDQGEAVLKMLRKSQTVPASAFEVSPQLLLNRPDLVIEDKVGVMKDEPVMV